MDSAGNRARAHSRPEVSEKLRITRSQAPRIDPIHAEHGAILLAIAEPRCEEAQQLLRTHIETSKAEVRKITLHMLHSARQRPQPVQG
ncbi:hypothetical protein NNO07_14890 [Pseudomonas resinovorans]|uniref:FCD domain-containing protein n=1 Tax=Metapseudomonas resinovorans TaxID=53412 RepID=A0ABT4Y6Q0_METRE|nr:hypothetical protein [Pseudomonas resinovorans]MDA8484359.1 hypothetical protein [Pseudomonas resinovorans]